MIFFGALFFAVVLSWIIAMRTRMNDQQWLLIFFFIFLGLWSGMHFWGMVLESLAASIWWAV